MSFNKVQIAGDTYGYELGSPTSSAIVVVQVSYIYYNFNM